LYYVHAQRQYYNILLRFPSGFAWASALNASLRFGATPAIGRLQRFAALQLQLHLVAVAVAVLRGRLVAVGALHGHTEQRFVALRVPVDRRDHHHHVGGRGRGRTATTTDAAAAVVGRRRGRVMVMVMRRFGLQVPGGPVDHGLAAAVGGADDRVQRHGRVPEARLQVPGHPVPPVARVPAQRLPERSPVLHRHQVVQDRVDRRREVIEATGDRVQQLVGLRVVRRVLGVQVEQPLRVERRPAQEERDDDGR